MADGTMQTKSPDRECDVPGLTFAEAHAVRESQRQANREGLHDGSGLERVRDCAIAQRRPLAVVAIIGIVRGQVDQRQDFACAHVDDYACTRLGLVLVQRLLQGGEGVELQAGVDGQQ